MTYPTYKPVIVKNENIKNLIYTIRGLQVMIDRDLAELYGVETKQLNQQVKRNIERFPRECCFQLTAKEDDTLRSQIVTSKPSKLKSHFATSNTNRGGRRYLPYVFTEQGVAMLSGVLKSRTAVKISIQIINAFVVMRKFIAANGQIFKRLNIIEQKQFTDKANANKKFKNAHDRFLIIDDKDVYDFGASLKYLGKKWFAFSKFNKEAFKLVERLKLE